MEQYKTSHMKKKCRDKLIFDGIQIVNNICSVFINKYQLYNFMSKEDLEDLNQDCIIEMINVVNRFDTKRNLKLITYLTPRIQGFLKDQLKKLNKQKMLELPKLVNISEYLKHTINEVFSLNKQQLVLKIKELNLTNSKIKNISIDISNNEYTYEIFDSLFFLPNVRIYIILSYYILDKSIKEVSKELNFNPNTGWVYRMKREGIKELKRLLKQKQIIKQN